MLSSPLERGNPVAPARGSASAAAKAAARPVRSYQDLLAHLATLTRNTSHIGSATFDQISEPTPTQRRVFQLLGVPIPLTLA